MILISRRNTSPGTSPIREAVNKVTCSRSSPGCGPPGGGLEWRGARRRGASLRAGACPAGVRNPVSAFFGLATFSKGGIALASHPPPLPYSFHLGPPHPSALPSFYLTPKWRAPLLHGRSLGSHSPSHHYSPQPQVPKLQSFAFSRPPTSPTSLDMGGWGTLSEALLKLLAEGTLGL